MGSCPRAWTAGPLEAGRRAGTPQGRHGEPETPRLLPPQMKCFLFLPRAQSQRAVLCSVLRLASGHSEGWDAIGHDDVLVQPWPAPRTPALGRWELSPLLRMPLSLSVRVWPAVPTMRLVVAQTWATSDCLKLGRPQRASSMAGSVSRVLFSPQEDTGLWGDRGRGAGRTGHMHGREVGRCTRHSCRHLLLPKEQPRGGGGRVGPGDEQRHDRMVTQSLAQGPGPRAAATVPQGRAHLTRPGTMGAWRAAPLASQPSGL